MIATYGLTHIALKVKDVKRSSAFYRQVFGAREMYGNRDFVQLQTPGSHDILVLESSKGETVPSQLNIHFGFRLIKQEDMNHIIQLIEAAGGKIKETGEFVANEPYVFFYDPDGYEIEVWYENIPPELVSFN